MTVSERFIDSDWLVFTSKQNKPDMQQKIIDAQVDIIPIQ